MQLALVLGINSVNSIHFNDQCNSFIETLAVFSVIGLEIDQSNHVAEQSA